MVAIAVLAAVIGPVLAEIASIVMEIIRLVIITVLVIVAGAALTGITVLILRRRASYQRLPRYNVTAVGASAHRAISPVHHLGCWACGGTGEISWATPNGQFVSSRCAVCPPAGQAR